MAKEQKVAPIDVNMDVLDFGAIIGSSVETRFKFKPRAEFNDLCPGCLVSTNLNLMTAPAEDKNGLPSAWEYANLDIPNLKLLFVETPTKEDPAERVYEHVFSPFTNTKNDGTVIERSKILKHYSDEYKQLRHIANTFMTNKNFDKSIVIPSVNPFIEDPIARLANIAIYYAAWAKMLKGIDGNGFPAQENWMKLTTSYEGTYLKFPDYVNEGFIEKRIAGRAPTIEMKPADTIVLIAKAKGKVKAGEAANGTDAADDNSGITPEIAEMMKKYQQ